MKQRTEQEDLIVRYLFGESSEDERSQLERRFLVDNEFFEQMLSVEDALIDAYVQGELSSYERKKVESLLSYPERRAREISFVQDLIADLERASSTTDSDASLVWRERRSKWRSLLALLGLRVPGKRFSFALFLVLAIMLGLTTWNIVLQNKLERMNSNQVVFEKNNKELLEQIEDQTGRYEKLDQALEEERKRGDQLEQELAVLQESKPLARPSDITVLSLALDSFSRSGGELKVITLRTSIKHLRITVELGEESNHKSYDAEIRTFEGREVWSKSGLKATRANPSKIYMTLPAGTFSDEDYTLTLKSHALDGKTVDIGYYSFRIKR